AHDDLVAARRYVRLVPQSQLHGRLAELVRYLPDEPAIERIRITAVGFGMPVARIADAERIHAASSHWICSPSRRIFCQARLHLQILGRAVRGLMLKCAQRDRPTDDQQRYNL